MTATMPNGVSTDLKQMKNNNYESPSPSHLQFFIFGNNISHSLSPVMHNAAFAKLGLPYQYSICQTTTVDDLQSKLESPAFGGASVTFPHKLAIRKYLSSMSSSAKQIGAINTILVKLTPQGRTLIGDNTDWIGINRCIQQSNIPLEYHQAVIIGAGGAARAATFGVQQLGIKKVLLVNRTLANAEKLASDFPLLEFTHFSSFKDLPSLAAELIIACVPADDFVESDYPVPSFRERGVLVEMAYRPQTTALMKAVEKNNNWSIFRGIDVLKYQAYEQCELWTGQKAPTDVMDEALRKGTRL